MDEFGGLGLVSYGDWRGVKMDEKVREIESRLQLKEIGAFPWTTQDIEDVKCLLSLLAEKEKEIKKLKEEKDG